MTEPHERADLNAVMWELAEWRENHMMRVGEIGCRVTFDGGVTWRWVPVVLSGRRSSASPPYVVVGE